MSRPRVVGFAPPGINRAQVVQFNKDLLKRINRDVMRPDPPDVQQQGVSLEDAYARIVTLLGRMSRGGRGATTGLIKAVQRLQTTLAVGIASASKRERRWMERQPVWSYWRGVDNNGEAEDRPWVITAYAMSVQQDLDYRISRAELSPNAQQPPGRIPVARAILHATLSPYYMETEDRDDGADVRGMDGNAILMGVWSAAAHQAGAQQPQQQQQEQEQKEAQMREWMRVLGLSEADLDNEELRNQLTAAGEALGVPRNRMQGVVPAILAIADAYQRLEARRPTAPAPAPIIIHAPPASGGGGGGPTTVTHAPRAPDVKVTYNTTVNAPTLPPTAVGGATPPPPPPGPGPRPYSGYSRPSAPAPYGAPPRPPAPPAAPASPSTPAATPGPPAPSATATAPAAPPAPDDFVAATQRLQRAAARLQAGLGNGTPDIAETASASAEVLDGLAQRLEAMDEESLRPFLQQMEQIRQEFWPASSPVGSMANAREFLGALGGYVADAAHAHGILEGARDRLGLPVVEGERLRDLAARVVATLEERAEPDPRATGSEEGLRALYNSLNFAAKPEGDADPTDMVEAIRGEMERLQELVAGVFGEGNDSMEVLREAKALLQARDDIKLGPYVQMVNEFAERLLPRRRIEELAAVLGAKPGTTLPELLVQAQGQIQATDAMINDIIKQADKFMKSLSEEKQREFRTKYKIAAGKEIVTNPRDLNAFLHFLLEGGITGKRRRKARTTEPSTGKGKVEEDEDEDEPPPATESGDDDDDDDDDDAPSPAAGTFDPKRDLIPLQPLYAPDDAGSDDEDPYLKPLVAESSGRSVWDMNMRRVEHNPDRSLRNLVAVYSDHSSPENRKEASRAVRRAISHLARAVDPFPAREEASDTDLAESMETIYRAMLQKDADDRTHFLRDFLHIAGQEDAAMRAIDEREGIRTYDRSGEFDIGRRRMAYRAAVWLVAYMSQIAEEHDPEEGSPFWESALELDDDESPEDFVAAFVTRAFRAYGRRIQADPDDDRYLINIATFLGVYNPPEPDSGALPDADIARRNLERLRRLLCVEPGAAEGFGAVLARVDEVLGLDFIPGEPRAASMLTEERNAERNRRLDFLRNLFRQAYAGDDPPIRDRNLWQGAQPRLERIRAELEEFGDFGVPAVIREAGGPALEVYQRLLQSAQQLAGIANARRYFDHMMALMELPAGRQLLHAVAQNRAAILEQLGNNPGQILERLRAPVAAAGEATREAARRARQEAEEAAARVRQLQADLAQARADEAASQRTQDDLQRQVDTARDALHRVAEGAVGVTARRRLEEATERSQRAEASLANATAAAEAMRRDLRAARGAQAELRRRLRAAEEAQERVVALEAAQADLQRQLGEAQRGAEQAAAAEAQARAAQAELQRQLDAADGDEAVQIAELQVRNLQAQVRNAEEQRRRLQERVEGLERTIREGVDERARMRQERDAAQQRARDLRQQLGQARQQPPGAPDAAALRQARQDLQERTQERDRLRQLFDDQRRTIEELRGQAGAVVAVGPNLAPPPPSGPAPAAPPGPAPVVDPMLQRRLAEAQRRARDLGAQLQASQEEVQRLQQDLRTRLTAQQAQDLQGAVDRLRPLVAQAQANAVQALANRDEAVRNVANIREQLQQAIRERDEARQQGGAQAEAAEARASLARVQEERDAHAARIAGLEGQLQQAVDRRDNLQQRLDEFLDLARRLTGAQGATAENLAGIVEEDRRAAAEAEELRQSLDAVEDALRAALGDEAPEEGDMNMINVINDLAQARRDLREIGRQLEGDQAVERARTRQEILDAVAHILEVLRRLRAGAHQQEAAAAATAAADRRAAAAAERAREAEARAAAAEGRLATQQDESQRQLAAVRAQLEERNGELQQLQGALNRLQVQGGGEARIAELQRQVAAQNAELQRLRGLEAYHAGRVSMTQTEADGLLAQAQRAALLNASLQRVHTADVAEIDALKARLLAEEEEARQSDRRRREAEAQAQRLQEQIQSGVQQMQTALPTDACDFQPDALDDLDGTPFAPLKNRLRRYGAQARRSCDGHVRNVLRTTYGLYQWTQGALRELPDASRMRLVDFRPALRIFRGDNPATEEEDRAAFESQLEQALQAVRPPQSDAGKEDEEPTEEAGAVPPAQAQGYPLGWDADDEAEEEWESTEVAVPFPDPLAPPAPPAALPGPPPILVPSPAGRPSAATSTPLLQRPLSESRLDVTPGFRPYRQWGQPRPPSGDVPQGGDSTSAEDRPGEAPSAADDQPGGVPSIADDPSEELTSVEDLPGEALSADDVPGAASPAGEQPSPMQDRPTSTRPRPASPEQQAEASPAPEPSSGSIRPRDVTEESAPVRPSSGQRRRTGSSAVPAPPAGPRRSARVSRIRAKRELEAAVARYNEILADLQEIDRVAGTQVSPGEASELGRRRKSLQDELRGLRARIRTLRKMRRQ